MSTERTSRAWMQIRADALRQNLARISGEVGSDVRMIPMVKADAYGLGVAGVVKALEPLNPWAYGVSTVQEGVELRDLGVTRPVLVSSPVLVDDVAEAAEAGLTLSASSGAFLAALAAQAEKRPVSFHLDIDTGIGRAGFPWDGVDEWAEQVHAAHGAGAVWSGCFTQLHSPEDDVESIKEQWDRLQSALAAAGKPEGDFVVHTLNSAGALRCPDLAGDAVRPGIFLYGGLVGEGLPEPEPVVTVRARVVHVRSVAPGTTQGYGVTYRAEGPERWATLAIGYGDGLPRSLGNRGHALVRGARVPIIGRISMDVTVVDITGVSGVQEGDTATLIGSDGEERITVDEVAEVAGTISYEVLTGFTPRVRRTWAEDEDAK